MTSVNGKWRKLGRQQWRAARRVGFWSPRPDRRKDKRAILVCEVRGWLCRGIPVIRELLKNLAEDRERFIKENQSMFPED